MISLPLVFSGSIAGTLIALSAAAWTFDKPRLTRIALALCVVSLIAFAGIGALEGFW